MVDHDRIALGVPYGVFPGTPDELRARLERVVTDSALTGWSLAP